MTLPLQLSTSYKADGALGGFLSGLQDSYGLANADRDLVDRDMKTAMERSKLEEHNASAPLRAIELANKLSEEELKKDDHTSGRRAELSQAEHATKMQEAIAKKSGAEVQNMFAQAQTMVAMDEAFGPQDPATDLEGQARWTQVRELGDRVGIKMPEQYSADALTKLRMGRKAAMSSIPYLQQRAIQKDTQDFQAGEKRLDRASTEGIANRHDATAVKTAEIKANGDASVADRMYLKPHIQRLEAEFHDARKKDIPVKLEDVKSYIAHSSLKDNDAQKQIQAEAKGIKTQLMGNPKMRTEKAIEYGLEPTDVEAISVKMATQRAEEAIVKREMGKFIGMKIQMPDGAIARVTEGGGLVPVAQGGASGVVPPSSPAAPAMPPTPKAAAPAAPAPPEAGAGFGVYPSAGGRTTASAAAGVDKKGNPAPMAAVDAATLAAGADRSMASNADAVRLVGQDYLDGVDRPNQIKELNTLKKQGKIPMAERSKSYKKGDVVITANGKLAVYNGRGFDPI
jgi:hypothetical protein